MSTYIKLVQGDTKPDIIVALSDLSTLAYVDLSDPSTAVIMKFRRMATTAILQTIPGVKITGGLQADGTIDTTITTPGAGGRVQFSWPDGALDIDPGNYEGEVSVTFSDGSVQTVADLIRFSLRADF